MKLFWQICKDDSHINRKKFLKKARIKAVRREAKKNIEDFPRNNRYKGYST